jgi:hypothetical protein
MRWPRRTTKIPDEVRTSLGLAPGERVLAEARLSAGSWLVASDRGLVGPELRLDWSSITHAQWYDGESALSVTWVDEKGALHDRMLRVEEAGQLPETVHERVTATILLSRRVRAAGSRGVLVVARRQPGSDDLLWQLVPDPGVDATAPDVQARVAAVMRQLAAELGN